MAIIKRSDAEAGTPEGVDMATALEEGPVAPSAQAAGPAPPPSPAPAAGMQSMAEGLPAALEPELRRIIDTAVARVAAIELDAIREARELTQRSEQEARDALRFALDRAFNLIATLELLATTVSGMAAALKIELDDAIDALRKVPEPESALARELAERTPAAAPPQDAPAPAVPPAAAEAPPAAVEAPAPPEDAPASPAPPEDAPASPPAAAAPAPPPEPQPQPHVEPASEAAAEPERGPEPAVAEAPVERNGYPPAERQAESLAAAGHEPEPEPEPEREAAIITAAPSDDGRPAVPARRRGIVRRLFFK